jgi:hypothetical protein
MNTKNIRESLTAIEEVMFLIDSRHLEANTEEEFCIMYTSLSEALATLKSETGVTTADDAFGEHMEAIGVFEPMDTPIGALEGYRSIERGSS